VVDPVTSHSGNSVVGVDVVDDCSVCADVVGVDGVEDGSGDVDVEADSVCVGAGVLVLSYGGLVVGDGALGVVVLGVQRSIAGSNVLQACTISRSKMPVSPPKSSIWK